MVKCCSELCELKAKLHVTQIANQRAARQEYVCRVHFQELVSDFLHSAPDDNPSGKELADAAECYVPLVISHQSPRRGTVFLKTFDGRWTAIECKYPDLSGLLLVCRNPESQLGGIFDLPRTLIEPFGATISHVLIDASSDDADGFASLAVSSGSQELLVPCRPCDAISIALRAQVPIYAANRILRSD